MTVQTVFAAAAAAGLGCFLAAIVLFSAAMIRAAKEDRDGERDPGTGAKK